jgi:hypothetical protein
MKSYPFSSVNAINVQALVDDADEIDSLQRNIADLLQWREAGLPSPRTYSERVSGVLSRTEADLNAVAPSANQLYHTSLVFGEAVEAVATANSRDMLTESKSERVSEVLLLQGELETAGLYLRWIVEMLRPLIPLSEKARRWLTSDRSRLHELPTRQGRLFYVSAGILAYSVVSWAATIFAGWYPQTTPYFPPYFLLLVSTSHGAQALPGILPYDIGITGLAEVVVLLGAELLFVIHFAHTLVRLHAVQVDFERRWQDERRKVESDERRLFNDFFSNQVLPRRSTFPVGGQCRAASHPPLEWW